MLGFGAIGQFAIGEVSVAGTGTETITVDKWYERLSEPVRLKIGLSVAQQQFGALSDPFPFVSFSWYEELSKPQKLTKSGLPVSRQQFLAFQPAPSPFVATGWFEPLSEPVRFRPALKPALQQFFAIDTEVIPLTKLMEWFGPLSEPVRFKLALQRALQQSFAAPSQLRPNPSITGTLAALETKDTFLGGAAVWNRVTSGEIGVIESRFTGGQIGVAPPLITKARVSISII